VVFFLPIPGLKSPFLSYLEKKRSKGHFFVELKAICCYKWYCKRFITPHEGGASMTKEQLIAAVAKEAKITKVAAAKAIDSVTDNVTKELKKGGRISLTGFGTFSVARRKARTGRNPRTGQTIKIAATKTAKFKPGSALKQAVK
jgi:DNA-binding protein HU-beta